MSVGVGKVSTLWERHNMRPVHSANEILHEAYAFRMVHFGDGA